MRLTRADTIEAFIEAVQGRVETLARSHTMLAQSQWSGADLRRLVVEEIEPYLGDGQDRLRMQGPDIAIAPEAVQALGMVIHELATNAAKYGALSVPEGTIEGGLGDFGRAEPAGGLAGTWRAGGERAFLQRVRIHPDRRGRGQSTWGDGRLVVARARACAASSRSHPAAFCGCMTGGRGRRWRPGRRRGCKDFACSSSRTTRSLRWRFRKT